MRIQIEFNPKKVSQKDTEDFRELLELLSKKYNFRWNYIGVEE